MFCPSCGAQNPDGNLFCEACGSKLEAGGEAPVYEQPQEETVKTKKKIKVVPLVISIVAAVIIVAVVVMMATGVISFSGGAGPKISSGRVSVRLVRLDEEKLQLFYNGKATDITFKDAVDYSTSRAMNSNNIFAKIIDDDDESKLYYITEKSAELIGKDITKYIVSQSNDYILAVDENEGLYYGNPSEGLNKIDKNIESIIMVLSPDGKTALYAKDEALYLYAGEETQKIGKEMVPVAVTNGAKLIYAVKSDGTLVAIDGSGNVTKISKNVSGSYYLNKNNDELLFFDDNGTAYITDKGSEKIKIAKDAFDLNPIVNYAGQYQVTSTVGKATILPFDSLSDHLYRVDGALIKVNKKYEAEKIVKADYVEAASNGTIAYINNNKLYLGDLKGNSEKIASKVATFRLSKDGKNILYVNEDNEIFLYKNAKETIELGEDYGGFIVAVSEGGFLFASEKSNKTDLSDISYTKDGKEVKKIDEDAHGVFFDGSIYTYTKPDDDEAEIYASKDAVKWELLYKYEK